MVYYSHLWDPLLRLAEWVGLRASQPEQNVLSPADIYALASLSDLEVIKAESRLLSPLRLFGIGSLINRFVSILPLIRQLSLRHYSVCRSLRRTQDKVRNASVIIPARNEKGNIEAAIKRMHRMASFLITRGQRGAKRLLRARSRAQLRRCH